MVECACKTTRWGGDPPLTALVISGKKTGRVVAGLSLSVTAGFPCGKVCVWQVCILFVWCSVQWTLHWCGEIYTWRDVHLGYGLVLCVTKNVGVSVCSLDGASLSSLKEGKGDVDVCGAKTWASVLDAREENKCSHVWWEVWAGVCPMNKRNVHVWDKKP